MRITDINVDGFGVWSGLELASLSEGLNVFYGPNEAGKTTLMHFVRSLFFGFSPDRRERYLPPLGDGRPGGTIQLLGGDVHFSVSRFADDGTAAGQLLVTRGNRQSLDGEHTLTALLGEVDEPTFNNVFVFGLHEIQELATLGDTRAAEELYGLALGLDRVSLVDVLKELNTSRERLLAADDRSSLVSQLLGQRERLQSEIDELGQSSLRYLSLAAERQRLDAEIEAYQSDHDRWEQHNQRAALARSLADRWHRRDLLTQQLQMLGNVDSLPVNGLERFEQLEAGLTTCARRIKRLKRKRRILRGEIDKLKINEALRRHSLRIEALAEQQPWMSALDKQIRHLENELLELEANSEETNKQWAVGGRNGAALSKRAIDELRKAARDMQRARRDAQEHHERAAAVEQDAAAVRSRVDEVLGGIKNRSLTEAVAEAGEQVSMLRKRVQLDERISQMTTRESELEEQGHELLEKQMLSTTVVAGLGALFVVGCALILLFVAGLLLPASLGDSLRWPIAALGLGMVGAAGALKFFMERGAEGRVEKCHQQLSALGQQIKQAKEERDELDELLPRGGGPLVSRLQAAEKALSKLEELMPLEAERDNAATAAAQSQKQTAEVRDRCRDTRKRWRRLLAENGLPDDLSPRQLKSFARGRRQAADLGSSIEEKQAELARRRIEFESLAGRVEQLVQQIGIAPKSNRPIELLQQCQSELAEQQSLHKQRSELNKQIAKLREKYNLVARRRSKLKRRRIGLLRSAGTLDPAEFRSRAALQADALRLRGEHAQLDREINAALASDDDEQVATWLANHDNLDELESHAGEARRAAAARLSEAAERRGELNHRLKLLAEDRQLADKRLELEIVEKRLADALQRWRVLAVCHVLLVAVREFYEREHQPQVLREASGYLKKLTGGRYTRVWTPLGQHALRVDDQEGHSLTVEVLSSGTREQLFLALRMALAASFARRGIQLPLVLDDVLVNFDVGRARAAALVLRNFAKNGHQVLVFTCHEHIAKLFRTIKAEVRNLPDRLQGLLEEPQRPKRKPVEIEPEPEPEPLVQEEPVVEPEPEPTPEPEPVIEVEAEPVIEEPEIEEVDAEIVEPVPDIIEVEAEIVAEPEPEPAPPPPPPVEKRKPAPKRRRRRVLHRTEQIRWSAEEFDGELADRVRRDFWIEEELEPELAEASDDSQAA